MARKATLPGNILKMLLPGQMIALFWRHEITFATVHVTYDDIRLCDGPGMLIRKTAKQCINSTWIALLIHGFMPFKTWLLIVCGMAFYAIIADNMHETFLGESNNNTYTCWLKVWISKMKHFWEIVGKCTGRLCITMKACKQSALP